MLTRQTLFASTPFENEDPAEIAVTMLYCDDCHTRLALPDDTPAHFPAASLAREYSVQHGWLSVSSEDSPTTDICSDCRTNRSDKSDDDETESAK